MREGDEVFYVGTLPNGPARVVEIGDGRAIIELAGTGRVECAVTDLQSWYAHGGDLPSGTVTVAGESGCALVWPTGSATEQAVAGAKYVKQNYGGTDSGGSRG